MNWVCFILCFTNFYIYGLRRIYDLFKKKTNEKGLKTSSFNDKDKIKGKVDSTMIDFLV